MKIRKYDNKDGKFEKLTYQIKKLYFALDAVLDIEKYGKVNVSGIVRDIRTAISDLEDQIEDLEIMNTETKIRYEAFEILEDEGTQTIDSDTDLDALVKRNIDRLKDKSVFIDKWDGDEIVEGFSFPSQKWYNEQNK